MLTRYGYTSLGGHYFDGFRSNLVHTFPPLIAKMSLSIGQKNPSILVMGFHPNIIDFENQKCNILFAFGGSFKVLQLSTSFCSILIYNEICVTTRYNMLPYGEFTLAFVFSSKRSSHRLLQTEPWRRNALTIWRWCHIGYIKSRERVYPPLGISDEKTLSCTYL